MAIRWAGAVACVYVAVDCAQKAMGNVGQNLFSESAMWVWWIFAFAWVVTGFALAVQSRA